MNNENISIFIDGCKELGLSLSEGQLKQFIRYYEMLIEKNKVMNLTAITDFEEVIKKHFLDSLVLIADNNVSRETFGGKNNNKIVSRETITRIDDQNIEIFLA